MIRSPHDGAHLVAPQAQSGSSARVLSATSGNTPRETAPTGVAIPARLGPWAAVPAAARFDGRRFPMLVTYVQIPFFAGRDRRCCSESREQSTCDVRYKRIRRLQKVFQAPMESSRRALAWMLGGQRRSMILADLRARIAWPVKMCANALSRGHSPIKG